jgi:hypothetical protein
MILNGQGNGKRKGKRKEKGFGPSHVRVDPFDNPSLGRDSMGETQELDLMDPVPQCNR